MKMKVGPEVVVALLLTTVVLSGCNVSKVTNGELAGETGAAKRNGAVMALDLTSPAFEDGGAIPDKYTCDGESVNPPLEISGVENDAESLVLIVDDPDAPGGDWVHWLVWNIDPTAKTIEEGSTPDGAVEGYNDFSKAEYGGPCPPSGRHRYQFKLYALDTELELDEDAERKALEKAMAGHIVDEVVLTGYYERGN